MIAASASPRRDEQRHYSPTKNAALKHECLSKQHRDQSPRPLVQPVVSFGSHGAIVTTAGPVAKSNSRPQSPSAAAASSAVPQSPTTAAVVANAASPTDAAMNGHSYHLNQHEEGANMHQRSPTAAIAAGKRGKLESLPSITGSSMGTKRQVLLDHSPTSADSGDSPRQADQLQQQPETVAAAAAAPAGDSDQPMQDADLGDQHFDENAENVIPSAPSMLSPFGEAVPPEVVGNAAYPDRDQSPPAQQQQQQQQLLSSLGDRLPASAGQMLPPSSSGGVRWTSATNPSMQRPDPAGIAAAAVGSSGSGRQNTYMAGEGRQQGFERSGSVGLDGSEASLSVGDMIACNPAISGAASLEGWLPASAIAAAVAAAVAEQQSGSPRAAAAAAAAAALMRSSSTVSTASINRQGSLVFPLAGQQQPQQQQPSNLGRSSAAAMERQGSLVFNPLAGQPPQQPCNLGRSSTATLESQGSFAGWPAGTSRADTAAANNAADSAFNWPSMPLMRTLSEQQEALRREDSLKLDIQFLAPVIPEDYPVDQPIDDEDPQQQQYHLQQQQLLQQQQQQHVDKAFFAKVNGWEAELVGMLEQQQAPLAIRQIVAVFKDRINTERDKSEFKALCDKWTGVVEYPAGSGIKCLAIKSWMRDGAAAAAAAGRGAPAPHGVDQDDDQH